MLISHPDRTLQEHLIGLQTVIDIVLNEKEQSLFDKKELQRLASLLVIYHDIGKATDFFQYRIIEATVNAEKKTELYYDNEQWLKSHLQEKKHIGEQIRERSDLTPHAKLGAYLIQAEWFDDELNLDHLIMLQAVKKHHGNIENFKTANFIFNRYNEDDKKVLIERYNALNKTGFFNTLEPLGSISKENVDIQRIIPKFEKHLTVSNVLDDLVENRVVEPFLKMQFLFSLLLSADKGDVKLKNIPEVFKRQDISSNLLDKFKAKIIAAKKCTDPIDKDREEAYETVLSNLKQNKDAHFFSITLPTGLGKTFASYKAALWLKENEYPKHRIIYCLPFTSIIDQNAALFKAILRNGKIDDTWLTIHHYLTQIEEKNDESNENDFFQENEYVTEGWQNEIIVTTFVQLLESIFTNRNKKIRKFHNLVNSIIILDEVQNIPPKYYEAIEIVFEHMAKHFNTRFIFVTATQPLILSEKVKKLAVRPNHGDKDEFYFFEKMERTELHKKILNEGVKEVAEIVSSIKTTYEEGKSVLAIFNTINQSQEAYELIKSQLPNAKVRYLSGALTPFCRKSVIRGIKADIQSEKKQILISTQVVEAGVDIDFDCVYRDFATMDSINQSAGRCNRNSKKGVSQVVLFDCGKSKAIYKGDSSILLNITRQVLDEFPDPIPEKEIFKLNKRYFELVKDRIQNDNETSKELMDMIYKLQFEDLDEAFELIPFDYPKWNVFIPLNKSAKKIWQKYQDTRLITDRWERKAEVKKLMPILLQYVVAIPEQYYQPKEEDKEKPIIHEPNWRDDTYSLETGYIRKKNLNKFF